MLMNPEADTKMKLEFTKLHKNAHIPGYKGHCPKIDQVVGQRFSESSKLSFLMHQNEQDSSEINDNTLLNPTKHYNNTNNNYKEYTNNIINKNNNSYNSQGNMNLPTYNNYNRYTKNMNSGYTGHIPNHASGFGKTFTETSNMRLMEHFRNIEMENERNREREMGGVKRGKPQFTLQDVSPQMKKYMQARTFKDTQSIKGRQPIGGYQGHVPRKMMGENSVGTVDEKATRKALETFKRECNTYASTQAFYRNIQPLTCHCKP